MAEVAYNILMIIAFGAVSLLILYWASPDRFNLIYAVWDFYILKRTPRITITRGLRATKILSLDRTGLFHLKQRLNYLKKLKKYPLERAILTDIISHFSEYRIKNTGKHKTKFRAKKVNHH